MNLIHPSTSLCIQCPEGELAVEWIRECGEILVGVLTASGCTVSPAQADLELANHVFDSMRQVLGLSGAERGGCCSL